MRIFIVGAGEVGVHIASSLVREDHDLVVIERDAKKVAKLQSSMDILAVAGDGCNPEILKAHGIANADLFFAVSNDDSTNLLSALTARSLGAQRCVVRIGEPYHGKSPLLTRDPDITPLFPERLVAEEIFGLTRVPGASKARFFAEGRLVLLQARPSSAAHIYGRPLQQLDGPEGWVLIGIQRASGTIIPRGDTELRRGDLLYAVGRTSSIPKYLASIGVDSRPARRVVIAGAGQVGQWLAKLLVEAKVQVSVIQRGASRAFDLAAEVPEALVLRGDARDPDILRDAGIEQADYFVSAPRSRTRSTCCRSARARARGAKSSSRSTTSPSSGNCSSAVRVDLPLIPAHDRRRHDPAHGASARDRQPRPGRRAAMPRSWSSRCRRGPRFCARSSRTCGSRVRRSWAR